MNPAGRGAESGRLLTAACLLVLLALPFLIFWPVTLGQQTWTAGDFSSIHYPSFRVSAQQWKQGHLPLWNPYIFGGTPLAASQQGSVFYPLNVVLALTLPASLALGYSVLIHLSLSGLGMFVLLRSLRLYPVAACLGAVALELGGFAMSHLGHLNFLRALPWIGFALWSYNLWVNSRNPCYLIGLALSAGLLFLSGQPQIMLYAGLFIGSYLIFARRPALRTTVPGLAALGLGLGLSAVQLWPGAVMWLQGEYLTHTETTPEIYLAYSFHPAYVATLLFPRIRAGTWAEMVAYVGVAPLLLAPVSFLFQHERETRRMRGFFGVWAIAALVLSLGGFVMPLTRLLSHVPVYGSLSRVASRHLLEFSYSMAVLAALGLDDLLRRRQAQGLRWFAWAVLAAGAAGWLWLSLLSPFSREVPPLRWEPGSFQKTWQPLLLLALSLLLIWMVWRARKSRWRTGAQVLLLASVIVDLAEFGGPIYAGSLRPRSYYTTEPAVLAAFSRPSGVEPVRVISFDAAPGSSKELLAPNYSAAYGVESLIGYDSLMLRPFYTAFAGRIPTYGLVAAEALEDGRFRDLLDLFGARYILIKPERSQIAAQYYTAVASAPDVGVYRNEGARPRVFPLFAAPTSTGMPETFGGLVSLLDYTIRPGGDGHAYNLQMLWYCASPVEHDYTLYLHYLDARGEKLAQGDTLLQGRGAAGELVPTSRWECPGYYRSESEIPREAVAGDKVRVALGLWVPETEARLLPSEDLPVDPAGRVLLEIENIHRSRPLGHRAYTDEAGRVWIDRFDARPGAPAVTLIDYRADRITASVTLDQDGMVVQGIVPVSGWVALIDGARVPIVAVDGLLQGVPVSAGRHLVEFRYDPASVRQGAVVSMASLVLVVLLGSWLRRAYGSSRPPAGHYESPE